MKRLALIAVAALGLVSLVPTSATAIPTPIGSAPVNVYIDLPDLPGCTAAAPSAVGLGDSPLTLRVGVLLYDASSDDLNTLQAAQAAYLSLGITITVEELQPVGDFTGFTGTDSSGLIDQAREAVGGKRPDAFDVVYLLTGKNLTAGGSDVVAGEASCIGGIAFDDQAFAVGEVALGAEIFAHELGHLLGAHHHYANCVEPTVALLFSDPSGLCTVMINVINLASLQFSTLNAAVVRGYAEEYVGG